MPPKVIKKLPPCPRVLTNEYKEKIRQHSYLGKKGYTIPKSVLEKWDELEIKEECTMIPFTNTRCAGNAESTKFFVFRENDNKLYIPRFYGIERYGLPCRSDIPQGLAIDCQFSGHLRPIQIPIVDTYLKQVSGGSGGGILEAGCGVGKTAMGIYIASVLKKKTLILVHKEFLMNQWIERIHAFLPTAKIGIIQADVFDIEGKDLVIGMIQTMYRKDFSTSGIGEFGLTIVDEVHRIGSEEFSKTLLHVSTPYMLGISATVERKDRLTRILYMYIGPKIYSCERETTDTVVVRGLKYVSRDEKFNEMEYDFRGNPKYSTMISKLCNFVPRSRFILGVLKDLINEDENAQIIVLCHNICLLEYLYRELGVENFATFGYYKGGMKKEQLKESEDKQIVLGSYSMASEGLDIPTLSTLVLATPKTDIVQCVGRILRVKRAKPIVVDIIDSHDTFRNQWNKRKAYYRKCKYEIFMGTSIYDCQPLMSRHTKQTDVEYNEDIQTNQCNVILDDDHE